MNKWPLVLKESAVKWKIKANERSRTVEGWERWPHTYNPSTPKSQAEGLPVQSQAELHSETLY